MYIILFVFLCHLVSSATYAPLRTQCPATGLVRPGNSLSADEHAYISSRRASAASPRSRALLSFLDRTNINLNVSRAALEGYVTNTTTALSFSGGGYRAMLNGAGVYQALDARTPSSSSRAGLLQGVDYLVGLSGGNWMVGSAAVADFATVPALRGVWRLQRDLVAPGGVVGTLENLRGIRSQVEQKERAGFATTITDYWGLALGRQLVERGGDGGVGVTWSGIRDMESFRNGTMPFPIVVADGRRRGEVLAETNATVYEFSPFEFGTWDRGLRLFSPVEYLGTAMDGGQPRGGTCVRGFDYAGFVMGTSSSLFNSIVADIGRNKSGIEGAALRDIVRPILEGLSKDDADIAEVCRSRDSAGMHSANTHAHSTRTRSRATVPKTTPWPTTPRWSSSTAARTARTSRSGPCCSPSARST